MFDTDKNVSRRTALRRIEKAERDGEFVDGWYIDNKTHGNTLKMLESEGHIEWQEEAHRYVRLTQKGRDFLMWLKGS